MKKNKSVWVALIFLSASQIIGQSVDFKYIPLDSAIALAKSSNKQVFLDFYATWCGPCKLMDKKTFTSKEVAVVMNESYISLKIDVDLTESAPLVNKYNIDAVPTYLILTPEKTVLTRLSGYLPEKKFIEELNKYKKK